MVELAAVVVPVTQSSSLSRGVFRGVLRVLEHPPPAQVVFSFTALHAQRHGTITNIKKMSIRTLALACKPEAS